jgi:hypothetical protein
MDLRKSLGAILDEASAGERFLVERSTSLWHAGLRGGRLRLDEDREAR